MESSTNEVKGKRATRRDQGDGAIQTRNMKRPREYDEIPYKDLVFKKKIGEGEFGSIYKGSVWGQDVALKVLKDELLVPGSAVKSEEALADFYHEVSVMRQLRHPNVVELLGVCCQKPKLCIVTEFVSGGTLHQWIRKNHSSVQMHIQISILMDIARGLSWLHHKGFLHRDLKPSNILMDESGKAKIADFGLTQQLAVKQTRDRCVYIEGYWGQAGTAWYMAPEVLENDKYGPKCDIYSLGIVACEMFNGHHPYNSLDIPKGSTRLAKVLRDGLRPDLPDDLDKELKALCEQMWDDDPDNRPAAEQVLARLTKLKSKFHARDDDEEEEDAEMEEKISDKSDNEGHEDEEDEEEEEEQNEELEKALQLLKKERAENQALQQKLSRVLAEKAQKQQQISDLSRELKDLRKLVKNQATPQVIHIDDDDDDDHNLAARPVYTTRNKAQAENIPPVHNQLFPATKTANTTHKALLSKQSPKKSTAVVDRTPMINRLRSRYPRKNWE